MSWSTDPGIPGYAMVKPLGINGAEVYLGVQLATGTHVVLKVWSGWTATQQQREALSARLRHPNILTVLEVGETLDGPFSVLEWLSPNASFLSQRIRKREVQGIGAVRVIEEVARAVQYARTQGMCLAQLNAADVLLTEREAAKVLPVFVKDESPSTSVRDDLYKIGMLITAVVDGQSSAEPWRALRTLGRRCVANAGDPPLSSMDALLTMLSEIVAAPTRK